MATTKTLRYRSTRMVLGLPLVSVACGPDLEHGERRGTAKGIIAIGDGAVGVLAIGGVALGGFAFGGVAIGLVAIGGVAIGYYALGGAAVGTHVITGTHQDPQAIEFFSHWFPGLSKRGG